MEKSNDELKKMHHDGLVHKAIAGTPTHTPTLEIKKIAEIIQEDSMLSVPQKVYILRAVNAHEELIHQFRCLETAARRYCNGSENDFRYFQKCVEIASIVLAQAEGK